jgi:pSer/pThr/pTyr-binding forkhead associated (FHA) protein
VTNAVGHQFCRGCGAELRSAPKPSIAPPRPVADAGPVRVASPMGASVCGRCGASSEPNARFCKFCGNAFPSSAGVSLAPGPAAAAPRYEQASGPLRAQVVVILRDGSEGGVYPLEGERSDVGSREGDIVLRDDPFLSPRHARIERRGDTFVLLDLGSTNGIYVRLREPALLSNGDMILIGQQVLRFETPSETESQVGPAIEHGVMVFGTPEQPRLARLVQYTTEGIARDIYYLNREETVIGREQADIVFADDPFLSRRHAAFALQRAERRCTLRDLGSSNGTAIRCRGERVLAQGDQFRLGRHLFRFDHVRGPGARNPA